jgi:STE24 endopeptidase
MEEFSREDIERGRRYHRPRYLAMATEFVLAVTTLGLLAFTGLGDALLPSWPWWAQALVSPAIVLGALELVHLPLAYWRGHVHEQRWGLSTQGVSGWAVDRLKALAVSIVISTALFVGLFGLARWTDAWPFVAAPIAAAVVVFLMFVAPVVLEPIFNKFEPLRDQDLADDLRALADRAGVPVRDVLVADASRRTTKENAYVSGFGATRRVVLFDTMLERSQPPELRAVIAHELAHRKYRDVLNFSAISVVAAIALVFVLWAVLGEEARDPRSTPLALLVLTLAQPLLLVLVAAISRRWEYRADEFALRLTRDLGALERTFRRLADSNVSDLEPSRVVYWLRNTHPTVPERIAALRETARVEGLNEEEAA